MPVETDRRLGKGQPGDAALLGRLTQRRGRQRPIARFTVAACLEPHARLRMEHQQDLGALG